MTPPRAQASFGPRAGGVTNPRAPGAATGTVRMPTIDDGNGNQARPQLGVASGDMSAERRNYENAAQRRLRAAGFG